MKNFNKINRTIIIIILITTVAFYSNWADSSRTRPRMPWTGPVWSKGIGVQVSLSRFQLFIIESGHLEFGRFQVIGNWVFLDDRYSWVIFGWELFLWRCAGPSTEKQSIRCEDSEDVGVQQRKERRYRI